MIGCIAASKRPHLFQHLVLISGSPRYLSKRNYNGGFNRAELDSLFHSMKYNFPGWVEGFVPHAIGVNDTSAVAEFEGSMRRVKPEIALSAARTVFLSDNRDVLRHVHVKSTIIQSENDVVVPESVPYFMKTRLGAPANVRILKTEGHFPQLTVPSLLLSVLQEALGIN